MNLRPQKNEYADFYTNYILLVQENDIVSELHDQIDEWRNLLANVSENQEDFRYADGKWSIKELLGHIVDTERVFSYRALRISRHDKTPLAGFEENHFVANSNFGAYELADLNEEFALLRAANVLFFKNLSDDAWLLTGTASNATVSVRALAFMMVGHVRHHFNILRERYSVGNEV